MRNISINIEMQSPPAPPLSGGETFAFSAEGAVVSPPDKGGLGGDFRAVSLIFFLFLFAANLLFAQKPIQQVIPSFSLARRYDNKILEKPGDINKSHIRVLAINQGERIVGLKVAGHSEESVCEKTTDVIARLTKELIAKSVKFGNMNGGGGLYFGYGVFDSPINIQYADVYEKFLAEIVAIETANPGLIQVSRISKDEFDKNVRLLIDAEKSAGDKTLFVYHQLPENFFAFFPVKPIDAKGYKDLVKLVKDKTGTQDAINKLKADAATLKEIFDELANTYLPYSYQAKPSPLEPGAVKSAEKTIIDNAFKTIKHIYPSGQPHGLLNQTKKLIERMEQRERRLNDRFLKITVKNWIDYAKALTTNDSLKKLIGGEQEFKDLAHYPQTASIEIQIIWQPPGRNESLAMLKTFYSNIRVYLELSKQLYEQHPLMLADACMRRWPTLSLTEHTKIYEGGIKLATEENMGSEFQFVAPKDEGAELFVSVSGKVFQVVAGGKSFFYNYEEFLTDELNIHAPVQILYGLINAFEEAPNKYFQIAGVERGRQLSLDEFQKLVNIPLENLSADALSKTPAERLKMFANELKTFSPTVVYANAPNRLQLEKHVLEYNRYDETDTNYTGLTRFGVERALNDPAFYKPFAQPFRALGSLECFVLKNDETMLMDMGAEYRPEEMKALGETPSAETAKFYRQFLLQLAVKSKDLPGGRLVGSYYESAHTSWLKAIRGANDETPDALRKTLEDGKELGVYLSARTTRKETLGHNASPSDLLRSADGKTLILTDFNRDIRLPVGVYLGQILLNQIELSEPTNLRLTSEKALKSANDLIGEAIKSGLIDETERQNPVLLAEMVWGVLGYGKAAYPANPSAEDKAALDPQYSAAKNKVLNCRQPLVLALLGAIEQNPQQSDVKPKAASLKKTIETLPKDDVFLRLAN